MRTAYKAAVVTVALLTYAALVGTYLVGVVAVCTYVVRLVWFSAT